VLTTGFVLPAASGCYVWLCASRLAYIDSDVSYNFQSATTLRSVVMLHACIVAERNSIPSLASSAHGCRPVSHVLLGVSSKESCGTITQSS
jgi:hypothetical protein